MASAPFLSHLQAHRAHVAGGVVAHFGDPGAERSALGRRATVHPLCSDGLLRVGGADAEGFLQGQLSNDIREVEAGRAQLTTWCTPQGRMLASFIIWSEPDGYLLQLPRELVPSIRTRLQRYVLRAKVQVTDVTDEITLIGVAGADGLAGLAQPLPDAPMRVAAAGNLQILMLRPQLYAIAVAASSAAEAWDRLVQHACPAGAPGWAWHRIQACLPSITAATQDRFVPQMANMEQLGGVSFRKGCYPGQEIVARAQYLGEVRRRLFLVHAASDAVAAGDEIRAESVVVGTIVNAAAAPDSGSDALAVLQVDAAARALTLGGSGAVVTIVRPCH